MCVPKLVTMNSANVTVKQRDADGGAATKPIIWQRLADRTGNIGDGTGMDSGVNFKKLLHEKAVSGFLPGLCRCRKYFRQVHLSEGVAG